MTVRTQFGHGQLHDIFVVNEHKFAIVHEPLSSGGALTVDMTGYNVILLAPIEAVGDISLTAQTVIVMSNMTSKTGSCKLLASGKVYNLGSKIVSQGDNVISGDMGVEFLPAILERKEWIRQEFKEGIEKHDANQMIDTLLEVIDAIIDPLGENEETKMDVLERLSQFQITDERPSSEVIEEPSATESEK